MDYTFFIAVVSALVTANYLPAIAAMILISPDRK